MTDSNLGPVSSEAIAGDSTPAKSIWGIMVGVFTAPTEAFAEFKKKPTIIIPLIAILVLAGVAGALMAEYGAMMQYEMLKSSTVIPPQVLEEMRQDALDPNRLTTGLFGAIAMVILGVISALVAWFLGSVIFGKKSSFKAVWGVELVAGLIPMVGGLLRLPMVYAKGTMMVSYGLAALLPGKDFTSILYSFLYYTDIFAVWGIIVGGIGYAAIFGLSRGKGIAIAAIAFALFVVISIGLSAVGMAFAGVDITFL